MRTTNDDFNEMCIGCVSLDVFQFLSSIAQTTIYVMPLFIENVYIW